MPSFEQLDLPYNAILCRYSEIATKGRNRKQFENLFAEGIYRALAGIGKVRLVRERGRIFVCPRAEGEAFSSAQVALARRALPRIMGLQSASPGFLVEPALESIERTVYETFASVFEVHRQVGTPVSYCMRARRSDKSFPLRSAELEVRFADVLLDRYPDLVVDLTGGRLRVELEIRKDVAFICYERISGPGGLPSGSGGQVLALLSGGIDSPVASYQMIRRGCLVDFVTFHSDPYTPPGLIRKVADLAAVLNRYQRRGKLVAVNLLTAQKVIRDTCQSRYRTLLYRRFMVRIACILARALGSRALVTGDNIGQVASQTLGNLAVISDATPLMILRPLLTFDKEESVALSRRIGALEISEHEVPDSCTVFAPRNPATSAKLRRIRDEEARLDVRSLVTSCLNETTLVDLETLEPSPVPGLARALGSAEGWLWPTDDSDQPVR